MVSIPNGVRITSQHGGGVIFAGQATLVAVIHPCRCNTKYSGDVYSLFEPGPFRSQNCCGIWKVSDPAIRSAASLRVRKSRGEQAVASSKKNASGPVNFRMKLRS